MVLKEKQWLIKVIKSFYWYELLKGASLQIILHSINIKYKILTYVILWCSFRVVKNNLKY